MLKSKVGDLVRLKPQRVAAVGEFGAFRLEVDDRWWRPQDLEEILPRPLAVGDAAIWYGEPVTVIAINGCWAWVDLPGGKPNTVGLTDLTRV